MVKLLLTAPHTQTYLSRVAVRWLICFSVSSSLSHFIVNCAVLLVERNGEGESIRAFVLMINISWSSVATFTWLPYTCKNSSNSPTAFPKGCSLHYSSLGPAAVAGWDKNCGKVRLYFPEDRVALCSLTAPEAIQAKMLSEKPTCASCQKLSPHGVRRELPPFFSRVQRSDANGGSGRGELCPASVKHGVLAWPAEYRTVRSRGLIR